MCARYSPCRDGLHPNQGTDDANKGTDEANKGTDDANQGTDDANKGTDDANKGTDDEGAAGIAYIRIDGKTPAQVGT